MLFAHDTTAALVLAADLVNTAPGTGSPGEALGDIPALGAFLDAHQVAAARRPAAGDLAAVRALRPRLLAAWRAPDVPCLADTVNGLLRDSGARPWLVDW